MSLDWKVVEEERGPLPSPEASEEPPRPPRRWRRWAGLLLALLLVGALAGGATVGWRLRQQQARLRAELTAVVEAEARAQAFGLREQAALLSDPAASQGWRDRYAALFDRDKELGLGWLFFAPQSPWQPPASLPVLRAVALQEGGGRAEVEVVWTGRSEVVERRAYRVERGTWRRSPVRDEAEARPAPREGRSAHFRFLADPADFEAMGGGQEMLRMLEGVRAHMLDSWPAPLTTPLTLSPTLSVTVEGRELATTILDLQDNTLRVNSPQFTLYFPDSPLPPARQQQRAIAGALCQLAVSAFEPDYALADYNRQMGYLLFLLPQAESHLVVLTADERLALRNAWREELGDEWFSPLEQPNFRPAPQEQARPFQEVRRWLLASYLFIEQLREQGHIQGPGEIAHAILASPTVNLNELFVQLTGLSREELEARARDYALTPE